MANGSSANMKFSKTRLSKMIQSGGFLTDISGITSGLDNIVNLPLKVLVFPLKSYSNELKNIDTENTRIIRIRIVFIGMRELTRLVKR